MLPCAITTASNDGALLMDTERTCLLPSSSSINGAKSIYRQIIQTFCGCLFLDHSFWFEHAAFFLGTLCAAVAATQDLQEALAYSDDDDDDDDSLQGGGNPLSFWNTAKVFGVASTFFYLTETLLETKFFSTSSQEDHPSRFQYPALFGLGALFDFFSSLFEDDEAPWWGFGYEVLSVHFFLFCAVLTFYRNGQRHHKTTSEKLVLLGDSLFLLGALIDLAASYGDHPTVSEEEGRTEWICNASMGLASSLTWMLDSILYCLADVLEEDDDSATTHEDPYDKRSDHQGGHQDEDTETCSSLEADAETSVASPSMARKMHNKI